MNFVSLLQFNKRGFWLQQSIQQINNSSLLDRT